MLENSLTLHFLDVENWRCPAVYPGPIVERRSGAGEIYSGGRLPPLPSQYPPPSSPAHEPPHAPGTFLFRSLIRVLHIRRGRYM